MPRVAVLACPPDASPGTYYAAKVGIGLKVRAKDGRAYLIGLMDSLEKAREIRLIHRFHPLNHLQMKNVLDDADAVGDVAGQAYIENFALRVFDVADAEDRTGRPTKCVRHAPLQSKLLMDFVGAQQRSSSQRPASWRY